MTTAGTGNGRSVGLVVIALVATVGAIVSCDRSTLTDGPSIQRSVDEPGDGTDTPSEPSSGPVRPAGVKLRINEVMVENTSTVADENGNYPAWVEIYNPSDSPFTTAGVTLSDNFLEPKKWTIPDVPEALIEAEGFLIVWLDGDDALGSLHANFSLAPGKKITLLLNGAVDDKVINFDAGGLAADQSVGRTPDGGENFTFLAAPTPGAANAERAEPSEPVEAEFIRGDVNADEGLNVTDMVAILKIIAGGAPLPACQDRADANDDGSVNLTDPVFLGQALFGSATVIPPPYPGRGFDPSPDSLSCLEES